MFCKRCGKVIFGSSNLCPDCEKEGQKSREKINNKQVIYRCNSCGGRVSENEKVCPYCNKKILFNKEKTIERANYINSDEYEEAVESGVEDGTFLEPNNSNTRINRPKNYLATILIIIIGFIIFVVTMMFG